MLYEYCLLPSVDRGAAPSIGETLSKEGCPSQHTEAVRAYESKGLGKDEAVSYTHLTLPTKA